MRPALRRTGAVFIKEIKDILNNKMMLLQFILFPLMALLLTLFIPEQEGVPNAYFVQLFAPMFAGMMPMVTIASVIGEEKEKKSLRVLAMSGVKPFEYLFGVTGVIFLLSMLGSLALGIIASLAPLELLIFAGVMALGIIASLILGSAIGVLSKNQTNATAMIMPISLITAFVPMIAEFNDGFRTAADILYTQQIRNLIMDFSAANLEYWKFLVIGANILVFLGIFFIAYKKKNLRE